MLYTFIHWVLKFQLQILHNNEEIEEKLRFGRPEMKAPA